MPKAKAKKSRAVAKTAKKESALEKQLRDIGVTILPDSETHQHRMEIKSESSDRVYVVSQRVSGKNEGQWECGCPGWIFNRKCKHLEAMRPILAQLDDPKRIK